MTKCTGVGLEGREGLVRLLMSAGPVYRSGMKPLQIAIKGERGYLFEGEDPGSFAFVPAECVEVKNDETFSIDEIGYMQRRWGAKNMRFNTVDTNGDRLFPDERKPVYASDKPGLEQFLARLRRGYGVEFSSQ